MKSFLFATLLMLSSFSFGATLAWDQPGDNTGINWKVYLNDTPIADVPVKQAVIDLPKEGGVLTVRAYKGSAMSAASEPLVIPAQPTNITIILEFAN